MRYLALDVGDERIGVAISDAGGSLARPMEIVPRVAGAASFLRLQRIVEDQGVEAIVVGLPLLPNGSEGKQVASTQAYVRGLLRYVTLPVHFWDERHTTQAARDIVQRGEARRRRGTPLDDVAAAVILQDYLDHLAEARP